MAVPPYDRVIVPTTNGVALFGITLPAWLPSLDAVSTFAGQMVPILSAIWLIVQIWRFVARWSANGQ